MYISEVLDELLLDPFVFAVTRVVLLHIHLYGFIQNPAVPLMAVSLPICS